ncbi:MAG: type II toxin-antitoxin system VapC family toxin [Saprospiraceae bacterium]
MSTIGKIFFDTAPFIYLLENHPKYGQMVDDFIIDATANNASFVTSILSLAEFGVVPERNTRQDLIADFEHLIRIASFEMLPIERQIAIISYKLRAKYPALKALDSLQLAAAISSGCDHFFTNDYKLKRVQEINVVIVDEL